MTQTLFDQLKNAGVSATDVAQVKKDVLAIPRVFTVSEFYAYLNNLLELEEVTIEGEISKIEVSKGYLIYFSINDAECVLPCLMYKNRLDALSIPVGALEVGTRIQITGYSNVYAKSGTFKLLVQKVALVGEGALKKAFELLKKKLEEEGLFRRDVKREIPAYPETIGLITSNGAAAYTDFMKVLKARWGGVRIYFYHTAVQGESAVEEITKAFEYFNTSIASIDAIVLTRGGGSLEDLAPFNAEPVVRAVRASKWPVICAVGHERDESLAELAADLRCSTPSNAAELLVPTRAEELQYLASLQKKLLLHMEGGIAGEKQQFERALSVMERFFQRPKIELTALREHLERSVATWCMRLKHDVLQKERLLKSFDPSAVLLRGYSITTDAKGHIIKSIQQVSTGDNITTSLYNGAFVSEVKQKE